MRNKRARKFILGGVLSVCVFLMVIFVFADDEKSIPHQNPIDAKISLYSGRQITPNAIAVNPQFKKIAFEVPPKTSVLSGQFAAVFESLRSFMAKVFSISQKNTGPKEYGSWIWTPIMQMTPEYMESVLAGAKENGVNVMYVSVDSYLDIFVMKDGAEKERLEKAFSQKLEEFISNANGKGIAVDAEAGWQNWAEAGNEYKALAILNYIKDFNAEHQSKFRGFQYDVEPYMLDSYKQNPAEVLANFVGLADKTARFLEADSLRFSIVVPDFYDKKDGATPKFSYNGKNDYAFSHLLRILDRKPDSSIVIMSYRNFAGGEDGAIEVSANEMRTVQKGSYNTRIIIAQETGDVPPPYITFHNTSKKYMREQIGKINSTFNSYSNFGGIAVHYVNALLALK